MKAGKRGVTKKDIRGTVLRNVIRFGDGRVRMHRRQIVPLIEKQPNRFLKFSGRKPSNVATARGSWLG